VNRAAADPIARALLYEGYLLYPYRRSTVKNRQRFSFAVLHPPASSGGAGEPSMMRTVCLARGSGASTLEAEARFLHLGDRDGWQIAVERTEAAPATTLGELGGGPREIPFAVSAGEHDGMRHQALTGCLTVAAEALDGNLFKITIELRNTSPSDGATRDAALLRSLVSPHLIIGIEAGELVSMLDPPPALAAVAAACQGVGSWPVLVGEPGSHDTVLSSPVILYDYPRVAPESPGDLFDGTEIDEILTLRILTLTDAEKAEMRATDPRAAALLDRCEALGSEELLRLHGALRRPEPPKPESKIERCRAGGVELGPGDRVRLRPHGRADIFDLALTGMAATISSVEQDYEDRIFVAVTLDDDPGRDLGATGQPGHRFFFRPDELEPIA
jgi:hypothetical protein